MKKVSLLVLLTFLFAALVGCGQTTDPDNPGPGGDQPGGTDPTEETFESKPIEGIDAVFDESLGYYNESPSVIQEGNKRYLFYTRNTTKYDAATDSIAVRVGTYSNKKWTYGDATTCITVSESGWDSGHVFAADVVKGSFGYSGKTYSYLMAYCGNNLSTRNNASIGLAVAETPTGEWVKVGTKPLVAFESSEWDSVGLTSYPGAIEPSLVSYDKGGKVYLFYEESENFKSNYCLELDCSDLDSVVKGGRWVIETTGISDTGINNPLLYGADYVYYEAGDELFAVREKSAASVTAEPKVSVALQVVRSSADVIDQTIVQGIVSGSTEATTWWSSLKSLDGDDTALDDDPAKILGYMRLFSPCIASDEYGWMLEYGTLEIFFTTQAVDGDANLPSGQTDAYRFSQMIHTITVTY